MKRKISQRFTLVILILLIFGGELYAQRQFDSHKGGSIWRHWYVKADFGPTALFGDISTYDTDPFKKLRYESKFSYSVSAGKWITDWGGAHFTFSQGQLKGIRGDLEANTSYFQYTFQGIINLTQLLYPSDDQGNFYFYAKVGYGLMDFNAILTNVATGDTIRMQGVNTSHDKRVTEWVIPFGFGGVYNIDQNFAINFDATYNYVNTDKLDGKFVSSEVDYNDNKDYYIYLSLGFQYTFNFKESYGNYKRPKSRRRIQWTR